MVLALWLGVLGADASGFASSRGRASSTRAAKSWASCAAFGALRRRAASAASPALSLDFLPAAAILVVLYFFATRALFYFTLLVRDKLEYAEKILILRWEIISYLLTLIAAVVVVAALQTLAPAGWVAVASRWACSGC